MLPLVGHLRAAPVNPPPSSRISTEAMGFSLLAELSCVSWPFNFFFFFPSMTISNVVLA